jgi:hypothetical protein
VNLVRRTILLIVVLSAACRSTKQEPAAVAALRAQAEAAVEAKQYELCAKLFARLVETGVDPQFDRYDSACCLEKAGKRDQAFTQMALVVEGGYRNFEHLERDSDLAGLHDDPRWASLVAAARANWQRHLVAINQELRQIFDEDQSDRRRWNSLDLAKVAERDRAHDKRVREILAAGGARFADDFYHAAMIFQHGVNVEDYRLAHELCLKAIALEPRHGGALWLAAASKDRELMTLGKPQLYGTQMRAANGWYERYPVDPSVTNAERARWGVEPIQGAK